MLWKITFNCLVCLFVFQPYIISGEFYTSISDMENLVPTVNQVVKHLDDYIQTEELKLQQLRRLVEFKKYYHQYNFVVFF